MTDEEKTKEQLIAELVELRGRVAESETLDRSTGVHNRRYFEECLENELRRSSRYGLELSLIMFDVDNFEIYTDRLGQTAGDEVLQMVGRSVRDCIRQMDVACRYAGGKFGVILPHTGSSGAGVVAERLRQTVERVFALKSMFSHIGLTLSLGIACFPTDELSPQGLTCQADIALGAAKQEGGNQTCLASDVSSSASTAKLDLSSVIENVKESGVNIVYAMATAVDARSRYTYARSQNVARYAATIGKALGLSGRKIRLLHVAALLHDIGKMGIPDSILRKSGPLDEEEWKIMRKHPELGTTMVSQIPELADSAPAIRHHHERYDGGGYPAGLKGEEIPLEARIIAVAEAYDNMTTPRSYHQTISHEQAVEELRRCSGTQFDPALVLAFINATG